MHLRGTWSSIICRHNPLDVTHTLGQVRDKNLHPNRTSNAYSFSYGQSQNLMKRIQKEYWKKGTKVVTFWGKNSEIAIFRQ